ncbi:sugar transferase [Leisingera sp. JC11]|uniref:sugar transferase n=1 Tax=Leisingera sp. JC11 TaxID=3042469 RepID=UPI00345434D3
MNRVFFRGPSGGGGAATRIDGQISVPAKRASAAERRAKSKPQRRRAAGAAEDAGVAGVVPVPARASASGAKTRGLLSGAELRTGYAPSNPLLDTVINRGLALLLLPLVSPLMLLIIVMQKLLVRGPVFYAGRRLGKDRKEFNILKFRTLSFNAGTVTRDQTLPRRSMTETRIGIYLRRSRLDELPQLINILRGDMVFVGPRPIRPEIEDLYREQAPGYEERFRIRPGLVGFAQALMTHETPKHLRARFNRMCCRTPIRYRAAFGFLAYVGFCVLAKSARLALSGIADRFRPLAAHKWLRAGFNCPPDSKVELSAGNSTHVGAICGISDEVLQFVSTRPFPEGEHFVMLVRTRKSGRICRLRVRAKIEHCEPVGIGRSGFANYATYSTTSKGAKHFVERYLLQSSVISS